MTTLPWPQCTDDSDCQGARWAEYERCLRHLTEHERAAALSALSEGSAVDLRGVSIDADLLEQLLSAVSRTLGEARFDHASFPDGAAFDETTFNTDAVFADAQFIGDAAFADCHFIGEAIFTQVLFGVGAVFEDAQFDASAWFNDALFGGDALFDGIEIAGLGMFQRTAFQGDVTLNSAVFTGQGNFGEMEVAGAAEFRKVRFGDESSFWAVELASDATFDDACFVGAWRGPIVCGGLLSMRRTTLNAPARLDIAARQVDLSGAEFKATAVLQLRYAQVDMTDAVLSQPVTLVTRLSPIAVGGRPFQAENRFAGLGPVIKLHGIVGVDASHLILCDVDLTNCEVLGAYHLDQLRLEGYCRWAEPPRGLRRGPLWLPLWRWTRRKTMTEEHRWRARSAIKFRRDGWTADAAGRRGELTAEPHDLAAVYRQLRKALEDRKDEPGAADFYYGEMEMRRHSARVPRGERVLLHLYWLVSGYGLRASRALTALIVAMTATVVLMMAWGLPTQTSSTEVLPTSAVSAQPSTWTIRKTDPLLNEPMSARWTAQRARDAVQVVINSVLFRSSGQDLTPIGTWIEMFSRLTEPTLLGLAALATRSRVKR
ncbi:pentapeptide repeat-containing protein [Kitasatospora sp. NPDC058478]|uniref:pentapeptide repeat-containing protein n=1 Tax=unclassified Kitasatospora TaxID=2633591 RepID=UPI00364BEDA4